MIVILSVIVAINTALLTSKQMAVQPIEEVGLDEEKAVDRFRRVLQFESVSYEDSSKFDAEPFVGLHAYLEQAFPKVHTTLKREVIGVSFIPGRFTEIGHRSHDLLLGIGGEEYDETHS